MRESHHLSSRSITMLALLAGAGAGFIAGGVFAQDRSPPAPRDPLRTELPPTLLGQAEALCQRGVRALARLQNEEGDFNLGAARNPAPVAITALGALALLSTGEIPGRTPHGRNVERAIHYLLGKQDRSKGPTHGYFGSQDDRYSKMHGHGYATLALAQVLGMLPANHVAIVTQTQVRTALEDAVRLIEACQDPHTGGWYYDPVPRDHEGSITVCMTQALRAAKDAGMVVDAEVVRRAVHYVERSQKPDGSFRYQLGSENSSVALTAAAVMTLNASGDYANPVLRKGMAYLTDQGEIFLPASPRFRLASRFPYYERLYVGEALFTAEEPEHFVRWYRSILPGLTQENDPRTGTWPSESYGEAYATAMTVLALSLPLQYLPIHQR